ncbi:MAG: putative quinol monooxygenase [Promethearchaeota archaeon]
MAIVIIATLKIKEGNMEKAKEILKKVAPQVMEAEEGCLAYFPHTVRGEGNENKIIFYEKYKDKAAFKTHGANLGKYMAELGPLLDGPADIKSCNEIL